MFFDTMQFNAMRSSIDALQIKQKVIMQNLANYETPGYKARDVQFGDVLSQASRGAEGDGKYKFQASITTENDTTVRPDGNNVDVVKENLDLFESYVQSAYLYQKVGGQFNQIRSVLNLQMR